MIFHATSLKKEISESITRGFESKLQDNPGAAEKILPMSRWREILNQFLSRGEIAWFASTDGFSDAMIDAMQLAAEEARDATIEVWVDWDIIRSSVTDGEFSAFIDLDALIKEGQKKGIDE